MGYRKILTILLVLAVIGTVWSIYGLCKPDQQTVCRGEYRDLSSIITPITAVLFLTSLVLIFFPRRFFITWALFSGIFIPLGVLLVFSTPKNCAGLFTGLGCTDQGEMSLIVSISYLVISIFIILIMGGISIWRQRQTTK